MLALRIKLNGILYVYEKTMMTMIASNDIQKKVEMSY